MIKYCFIRYIAYFQSRENPSVYKVLRAPDYPPKNTSLKKYT